MAIRDKLGRGEFEFSILKIAADYNISPNAVRKGISELIELKFIELVEKNSDKPNVYKITMPYSNFEEGCVKNEHPTSSNNEHPHSKNEDVNGREEYMKSVAGRRKKAEQQNSEIENDINNIDFNNINIYKEDINSYSIINKNNYMNNDEIKKLANRVLREVFVPLNNPPLPPNGRELGMWMAKQNRIMCKFLTEYRTEQVVATIKYFAEVAPPPNGVFSVYYYMLTKKTKYGTITNAMTALDYYKTQFIANEHEYKREEIEKKQAEIAKREQEEKELAAKRAEEVAKMNPDEFIAGMMGRFKLNIKKDE